MTHASRNEFFNSFRDFEDVFVNCGDFNDALSEFSDFSHLFVRDSSIVGNLCVLLVLFL